MTAAEQKIFEHNLKKATRGAYLLGIAFGLVIGLAAGTLLGYHIGSDVITVISWGEQHQA